MCFRFAKISGTKVMNACVLTFYIRVSDPKLTFLPILSYFWIFKVLGEYEDTSATERYFVKLLLVVKYTFCKGMVMWQECIQC